MGDAIVDNTIRVMSEAEIGIWIEKDELELQCPTCRSKKMFVSYGREFVVDLEKETSYETEGDIDPYSIVCFECGQSLLEER